MRVTPDGCTDIIWHFTAGRASTAFVGPMTAATSVAMTGAERFMGIRLRPGVLLIDQHTLTNHLLNTSMPLCQGIAALLPRFCQTQSNPDSVLDHLEHVAALLRHQSSLVIDREIESIVQQIDDQPSIALGDVYKNTPMSLRTIQRRFTAIVGVSPKLYARIRRYRLAARYLRRQDGQSLVELALSLGYADQAHFTREFHHFSSITPSAFLAELQG